MRVLPSIRGGLIRPLARGLLVSSGHGCISAADACELQSASSPGAACRRRLRPVAAAAAVALGSLFDAVVVLAAVVSGCAVKR
eukprot:6182845-Pleurochrysis_carterae.AAC.1